ncbi:hypothetical protein UNSW3_1941 [Campylobacter concisus UNSW3]|uniref:Uncharacterized protein n=1 Tax=Campylobacter concisus UNSW3 TaxID=1242966 RepID=U2G4H4_9BACT|nr:hypothetical protein UNSW3_1941 [Campylobacter concisus UNSW3]
MNLASKSKQKLCRKFKSEINFKFVHFEIKILSISKNKSKFIESIL